MSNPTTAVFAFVSDLDGESQSGAISMSGVDPIRYDGGLWLEEGTTNLVQNPSAEVDVSNTSESGMTRARSTAEHYVGAASFQLASDGVGAFDLVNVGVAGTPSVSTYTASAYFKGAAANIDLNLLMYRDGYTANRQDTDTIAMAASDWNRGVATASYLGGDVPNELVVRICDDITGASPHVIAGFVDAIQVENKPYATSYADSTLGPGYGGSSGAYTRAASSASVPMTDILNSTIGGVAFWATRHIDTGTEEYWITAGGGGSGNDLFFASLTSDRLDHKWNCDNAGVDEDNAGIDFPIDTPTFFYMAWSDIDTWTYQGGGSMQTSTRNMPAGNWGGGGDFTLQCGAGSMVVHEFMMLSRPLDDVELARLEGTQNWSMSTLGGSTIIMPLAGGRRSRA